MTAKLIELENIQSIVSSGQIDGKSDSEILKRVMAALSEAGDVLPMVLLDEITDPGEQVWVKDGEDRETLNFNEYSAEVFRKEDSITWSAKIGGLTKHEFLTPESAKEFSIAFITKKINGQHKTPEKRVVNHELGSARYEAIRSIGCALLNEEGNGFGPLVKLSSLDNMIDTRMNPVAEEVKPLLRVVS